MARRGFDESVLGRPRVVVAVGGLGILFVLWASAAPRIWWSQPAGRRPASWAAVDSENFIFKSGCWLCMPAPSGPRRVTDHTVGTVLGEAFVVAVGGLALLVLALALRGALARYRTRDDRSAVAGSGDALDLRAVADALRADAPQRSAALRSGTPSSGVIAAWVRLEETLEAAGVVLAVSRTSSEVVLTVLGRFDVDPEPLLTLAALYREARWSRHLLTEGDRRRAQTSYGALDIALRPIVTG